MAEVDVQKVVDSLALRLANKEVQNVVLEVKLEATRQELAKALRENAELREAVTEPTPSAGAGE